MADKRNDGTGRADVARGSEMHADGDTIARGIRNVDNAADRAANAVGAGADRAREKFDHAMDGVKRGAERARDGVHATTGRVEDAVDSARERVEDARERIESLRSRSADDLAEDLSELIREHPGKAVLIAGICGFIIGSIASGGRD